MVLVIIPVEPIAPDRLKVFQAVDKPPHELRYQITNAKNLLVSENDDAARRGGLAQLVDDRLARRTPQGYFAAKSSLITLATLRNTDESNGDALVLPESSRLRW